VPCSGWAFLGGHVFGNDPSFPAEHWIKSGDKKKRPLPCSTLPAQPLPCLTDYLVGCAEHPDVGYVNGMVRILAEPAATMGERLGVDQLRFGPAGVEGHPQAVNGRLTRVR
jgi:hypothetical protein